MYGGAFVVAIVAIVMAAGLIKHYMRLKEMRLNQEPRHDARIDELERRVQTLERIVTDKGYDLKREFDKL